MFTNSSVGVVFWNKVFSSDTVSGYKCSHFLVTMHSLLLGIFIKKTKMESFCTKTSPVRGGWYADRFHQQITLIDIECSGYCISCFVYRS